MTSGSLGSVLAYAPGPASLMLFTPSRRTRFLCRTYFDRADTINEIKSEMAELEAEKSCTPGQIVERLGEPKEMARVWRHVYSALYRDFGCGSHVQRCGQSHPLRVLSRRRAFCWAWMFPLWSFRLAPLQRTHC
ncbi:MAG: hypothetical protein HFI47_10025 [Lachnospiraceae bacterium]|nr:hypothetical protein [Lachnospiraceae bacterium]